MAWLLLFLAGLLEVVWAYAMKASDGFTNHRATLVMVPAMVASFVLLSMAMKSLPLGTAYAVWTSIGAVGAFIVGVIFFGDPLSATRLIAVALIGCGVALLKLAH